MLQCIIASVAEREKKRRGADRLRGLSTRFEVLLGGLRGGVLVGVVLAGFRGVIRGVGGMAVRYMSVVAGLLMVARFMVIGGGAVMLGGELVVFRGLTVVIDSLLAIFITVSGWLTVSPGIRLPNGTLENEVLKRRSAMQRILKRSLAVAAISVAAMWAGALTLEIGKPEADPQAKSMNAVLIARVTACTEPAKSKVTASLVRSDGGELRRTPLKVMALETPGSFAIVGATPPGSVIDLAVTNPAYDKNYQPRVLIRTDSHGVEWASVKRFYGTPPSDSDVKSILGELD
jgi:hypothetical protein